MNYEKFHKYTLIVSMGLFVLILTRIDWSLLLENTKKYRLSDIVTIIGFYLLISVIRSLRFGASIISNRSKILHLYALNMQLGFYQSIFPAQTADLLFAALAKRQLGIDLRHGNLSIFLVRISDVLILSFGLITSMLILHIDINPALKVIFSLLMLLMLFFIIRIDMVIRILKKITNYLVKHKYFNSLLSVSGALKKLDEELRNNYGVVNLIKILLYGVSVWLLTAAIFFILFRMLNINVSYLEAIFIVSLVNISALVPISSIGGIGVREPALILGLVTLGFKLDSSVITAILVRLPMYLLPLCFGAIFVLYRSVKKSKHIYN